MLSLLWLVELLMQSTAVCAVALAATRAVRHDAALRHSVLVAALAMVLLGPALMIGVDRLGLGVVRTSAHRPRAGPALSLNTPAGANRIPVKSTAAALLEHHEAARKSDRLAIVLLTIWIAGMGLLAIRLLHGLWQTARWRRRVAPLDAELAGHLAARTWDALGLRPLPPIAASPDANCPMAVGLVQPIVVLPQSICRDLPPDRLADVAVHECAHIARGDHWIGLLQRVAAAAFWFNPLIHQLNRELARAREEVCDNYVLLRGDRGTYARTLVELAQRLPAASAAPALALLPPRWDLQERIREILNPRRLTMTRTRFAQRASAAILMLAISLAAVSVVAQDKPEKDSSSTPRILRHHDGTAEGRKSLGGSGEMIRFEGVKESAKITALRIHGSRYGTPQPPNEDFTIYFLDAEMNVIATRAAPYRLFERGEQRWVQVKINEPVQVPGTFWVVLDFHAHQTKGVYVSYDTSTGGKFSKTGLPGEEVRDTNFAGDWMVEAVVGRP